MDCVYIQRIFPDYRKPVFDLLNEKISLRLLHSKNNSSIKQIETSYSIYVDKTVYGSHETNVFLHIFRIIYRLKPKAIVHELSVGILSLPLVLLFCRIYKIKFILHGHGYDMKTGFNPSKSIKDKYRVFLMRKADTIILYGNIGKEIVSKYVNPQKIFVALNTIDTRENRNIVNDLIKEGRDKVKQKINFKNTFNLIYIGRLLVDKKVDFLLDSFKQIVQKHELDVHLHIVGDGSERENLKRQVTESELSDFVTFHGAVHDSKLTGELLFASDIMTMPGYLGLSVNHAFCFGCPVITLRQNDEGPFHSPEIEYVVHGKTGFLVDAHTTKAYAETIIDFLNDKDLQEEMRKNVFETMSKITIENMTEQIIKAINS